MLACLLRPESFKGFPQQTISQDLSIYSIHSSATFQLQGSYPQRQQNRYNVAEFKKTLGNQTDR